MPQTETTDNLPGKWDFPIYRGTTFAQTIVWQTGDPATPVNLSGYVADMKMKGSDGTVAIELSTANGRILLGTTNGTITLSVSATDTGTLAAGTYVYDLILTSDSTVTPLLAGSVVVTQGVSV